MMVVFWVSAPCRDQMFEILDKCNASIFRVNELVQVDVEVLQCKKRSLLYRVVCGCLVSHSHTRQEGTTGRFQAKEMEDYGHPHQDGISLATVHLPQVTVFSHLPLVEVLKKKKSHIWNSQLPAFMIILSVLPTPVPSSAKFP